MPPTHPSQADVAAAYRTLIAHETEPKEQDFYRTRLQRLEPRTEPELDDFVTQLAVKQIEGEAAWWRSIDFDRNASRTFESMTGDSQQAVRTGVERVLAYLQSTGRLIPAGGMALTAEQVEDVRTAREALRGYRNFEGSISRGHVRGLIAAVDALFPATEPAEEVKPVKFRKMTAKYATANFGFPDVTVDPFTPFTRWAYKDSDGDKWAWNGDQWELHVVPPAPAEPAEDIESLIERSSLGTESTQDAIDSVSPEHGRRVARMAAQRGKVDEPRITSEGGKRWHLTETEYVEFDAAGDIWINMGPHIKDARKAAAALLAAAEAEDDAMEAAMQGEYPPAPAEPAEEETKAEGHDPDALAKRLAWIWHDGWDACGERERGYLRRAAEMAHSHYASSPVVPAPTETEAGHA